MKVASPGVLLILLSVIVLSQTAVTVCQIASVDGDKYEGKTVTTNGTIAKYTEGDPKDCDSCPATVFDLENGGCSVEVWSYRRLGLHNGDKVAITGEVSCFLGSCVIKGARVAD